MNLNPGEHLVEHQKVEILKTVSSHREQGRNVVEILKILGIKKSSYYRWRKSQSLNPAEHDPALIHPLILTPAEEFRIFEIKAERPWLRHRKIQGELQKEGIFISASAIYSRLKAKNMVEPYERRPCPFEDPFYEVHKRDIMWGCDWTKIKIGDDRWYLLTVIDFFSRVLIAHEVVPTVHSGHIKAIYEEALANRGIPLDWHLKPIFRVDQGSPNKARVTQAFFEGISDQRLLSFARRRRPTDNAITERFYGTIKQEEVYLVESYPDEESAKIEIGKYIEYYNTKRPHQSLWNFIPAWVDEVNDKTEVVKYLKLKKQETKDKRKSYWKNREKEPSKN